MTENEKRKITNIRGLDKDTYQEAKLAALKAKQYMGKWLTDAMRQRLDREKGG